MNAQNSQRFQKLIKGIVAAAILLLIGFFWLRSQRGEFLRLLFVPQPKLPPVQVAEEDKNKDGKPDTYYYRREGILFRINRDRNFDSKLDEWIDVKNDKWSFRKADENFDRVVDVQDYFSGDGLLQKRERDSDQTPYQLSGNKFNEVEYYNAQGHLERIEQDTNRDGKPDVWKYFKDDALTEIKIDTDFDGKADKTKREPNSS